MAGKSNLEKRLFSTVPTRALFDRDLSALDWRVLGLIALHDGMSLVRESKGKPKGAGCVASNVTLAREAQCSYAALVRSLSYLEKRGHIVKQDRRTGKQLTAIRVNYPVPENVPDGTEPYDETVIPNPDQYDETSISGALIYDQTSNGHSAFAEDSRELQSDDYISLREELDVAKAMELDSPKVRHQNSNELYPAKAGRPMMSLRRRLPPNFDVMASHAQVPCIDRVFRSMGGDPETIITTERHEISSLLDSISEAYSDEPTGQQAARLYGEIAVF